MQAQVPHNPYTGLWSRLEGFRPESLSDAARAPGGRARRCHARDDPPRHRRRLSRYCGRWCSPSSRPSCARHPEHGPLLRDVDLAPVVAFARALLAEKPRSGTELRALFAERFPDLRPGCPRARLPDASRLRAGPPARALGPERTGEVDNGGVVARPTVRRRPRRSIPSCCATSRRSARPLLPT